MNLSLTPDADADTAIQWLRQLVQDFGPGFHLDTPPASYQLESGAACFSATECQQLEKSLNHLFATLGDETPYDVCADLLSDMLATAAGLKPPLEFNDPEYQRQLLVKGDCEQLVTWLHWNGITDVRSDLPPSQLRDMVREQIALRDSAPAR